MYERLLTEAERFLEEQKPKEVPILEMWDAMLERSEEGAFDMPENIGDFECLLEADKRFVFVNTKAPQEMADIDIGEEEGEYEVGEDFFAVEEIEKLGFNEHQSIGLKKYAKTRSDDDDDDGPVITAPAAVHKRTPAAPSTPKKTAAPALKKKSAVRRTPAAARKKKR
ncbi:MAG: hypothetical protein F9K22_11735 [Bacteroidetes bacterium]|nr:MAG: hypothetical protein F9K22_11735 [Bacteroidota bacterium]